MDFRDILINKLAAYGAKRAAMVKPPVLSGAPVKDSACGKKTKCVQRKCASGDFLYKQAIKQEAQHIGDPLGDLHYTHIRPSQVLKGAFGGLVGGVAADAAMSLLGHAPSQDAKKWLYGGAALLGAAYLGGKDFCAHGDYNYKDYATEFEDKTKPVVIAFAGGQSGAHRGSGDLDIEALDRQYGKGNYALFVYDDMDEAKDYLDRLPKDVPVRIQGHSLGGPKAYELAQYAAEIGRPIDRLDTIDPVGKLFGFSMDGGKPATTAKWVNHLARNRYPTNAGDIIAMIGGPIRELEGAENKFRDKAYDGHTAIRYAVPSLAGGHFTPPKRLVVGK